MTFLYHRALRIYPGLWACLVITVVAFAPLAAAIEGEPLDVDELLTYVLGNGLAWITVDTIPSTLRGVPLAGEWSGPLWTLFYELLCYAGVALVGALALVRRQLWVMPLGLVVGTALCLFRHEAIAAGRHDALVLGTFFAAGATLFVLADRVPTHPLLVVLAAAGLVGAAATGRVRELGAVPVAYLCVWTGAVLRSNVGRHRDLSYGVYIYGWPAAQLIAVSGAHDDGVALYLVLTLALTLPLAWLSWTLVERPALSMKHRYPGARTRPLPVQRPAEADEMQPVSSSPSSLTSS